MDNKAEKIPLKQKNKTATREELLNMDKDELVDRILRLEAHNTQLKCIISKNLSNEDKNDVSRSKKPFDFSNCHFRRILLHVMYFGWEYQGFVVQEDTTQTIEHHLFYALTKSCLIENRESSEYHRCGRTDKGVSSFGQVISLTIRSKHPLEEQDLPQSISSELHYSKILNRLLPKEIRVVGWMPIPKDLPEFSARFDCTKRTYKYYFPRSCLDLPAMRKSCTLLIGSHDFRHLCKMDVGNGVMTFIRNVLSADVVPVDEKDKESPTSMYALVIEGNAFLWHQIRCIMGVLLLVGQGKESPDIISDLFDVEKFPRKPQYHMALDVPLNLFHCSYDIEETNKWIYDKEDLKTVISHMQGEWTMYNIKSTMIKDALQQLEGKYAELVRASGTQDGNDGESERDKVVAHTDCLIQGVRAKVYTPLSKRETCSSLEERIEHYKKKRKIADTTANMECL